jgi:hypothetical protein
MEYPDYFAEAGFNSPDHDLRNWKKWKQLDVNAQRNRMAGRSSRCLSRIPHVAALLMRPTVSSTVCTALPTVGESPLDRMSLYAD